MGLRGNGLAKQTATKADFDKAETKVKIGWNILADESRFG